MRMKELRDRLLARNYHKDLIEIALDKAKAITRKRALKKVPEKKKNQRPVLAVSYDPRLPALQSSIAKHWRSMTQDSYLREVFQEPPLVAFRRQQNLRGNIIRAKVARKQRIYPKRFIKGMKKCGNNCGSCPYIKEGNRVIINEKEWKINKQLDCQSYNLVYAIFWSREKCNQVYIGETKRMLQTRVADHCGYVSNGRTDKATGAHFNMPGHPLADL